MILAQSIWLGLHWVDWIVLIFYLLAVSFIGFWSYRKVRDLTDFFMGDAVSARSS